MERSGLLKEGDVLSISEYELSNAYYYVVGSSFAMSGNVDKQNRLKNREGKVSEILETDRGFYVTMEFDEE